MLQRWTSLLATAAALTAILIGLSRHWEFWSVVKRATAAYLVMYGTMGILFTLARIGLRSEPARPRPRAGKVGERLGTNGTDSADSV